MALLNPFSWFASRVTEPADPIVLERRNRKPEDQWIISGRGDLYVTLTPLKSGKACIRFDDHGKPEFWAEILLGPEQLKMLVSGSGGSEEDDDDDDACIM